MLFLKKKNQMSVVAWLWVVSLGENSLPDMLDFHVKGMWVFFHLNRGTVSHHVNLCLQPEVGIYSLGPGLLSNGELGFMDVPMEATPSIIFAYKFLKWVCLSKTIQVLVGHSLPNLVSCISIKQQEKLHHLHPYSSCVLAFWTVNPFHV